MHTIRSQSLFSVLCFYMLLPTLGWTQAVSDKKLVKVTITDFQDQIVSGLLLEHRDSTVTILDQEDLKTKTTYSFEQVKTIHYYKKGSFGRGFVRGFAVGEVLAIGIVTTKEEGYFGRGFDLALFSVLVAVPASLIGGAIDAASGVNIGEATNGDLARFQRPQRKLKRREPGQFAQVYKKSKGDRVPSRSELEAWEQSAFPRYPEIHLQFLGYGKRASRFHSAIENLPPLNYNYYEQDNDIWRLGFGFSPVRSFEIEYNLQSKRDGYLEYSDDGTDFTRDVRYWLSTQYHQINLFYKPVPYQYAKGGDWQLSVGTGLSLLNADLESYAVQWISNSSSNSQLHYQKEILKGINALVQIEYFLTRKLSIHARGEGTFFFNSILSDELHLDAAQGLVNEMDIPENSIAPHSIGGSFGLRWHFYRTR